MTIHSHAEGSRDPSVERLQRWDMLCTAYEHAVLAGGRPPLKTIFRQVPAEEQPGLLERLLALDWHLRTQAGESPTAADYISDVPEFETLINSCLAKHASGNTQHTKSLASTVLREPSVPTASARATTTPDRIGDYEILAEIARGGMGVVYKARHLQLQRLAAVKLIRSGEFAGEQEIQRFQTEATAAAKLDHPGIVPVFEVGEQSGLHFLAMAFVDGQSLSEQLKQSSCEPKRAAEMMQQVAEAIQFAHEHGIIHRDLKPQNILIGADGKPRVTDFGLAKYHGSDSGLTATGDVIGTPSYMPPEQASGKTAHTGPLADVYSLGATLYFLLTGQPPFQAENRLETLLQVVEQEPLPPRRINPSVPVDLETICLKCLEKVPTQRYETAGALAEDLGRFLTGEPIHARPATRMERVVKWIVRKPMTAAALGLTAVTTVLLVIGVTIAILWRNAEVAHAEARDAESIALSARRQTEIALDREKEARAGEEEARKELEATKAYNQYVLNVPLAEHLWNNGRIASARQALEECPPHLRQWEWKYLHRKLHPEYTVMSGHTKRILDLQLSPNGKLLATCRGTARLWMQEMVKKLGSFPSTQVSVSWRSAPIRAVSPLRLCRRLLPPCRRLTCRIVPRTKNF